MAKRGAQAVGKLLKKSSSSSLQAGAEAFAKSLSTASSPKLSPSKPDRRQRTPSPSKLGSDIKPNTGGYRSSSPSKQTERPDLHNTTLLWSTSQGIEIHMSRKQSELSAHSLFLRERNIRECEKRFEDETRRHVEKAKEVFGKEIRKVVAMDGSGHSTIDRPDQTCHFRVFLVAEDGGILCAAHFARSEEEQEESDKTSPLWTGSLSSPYKGKGKGWK